MKKAICSLILGAVGVMAVHAEVPSAMAITNARVVTVSGPVLPRANIVMRNGLIGLVNIDARVFVAHLCFFLYHDEEFL